MISPAEASGMYLQQSFAYAGMRGSDDFFRIVSSCVRVILLAPFRESVLRRGGHVVPRIITGSRAGAEDSPVEVAKNRRKANRQRPCSNSGERRSTKWGFLSLAVRQ